MFEKIKKIIKKKKDQNIKSDALLEEEKNELIIERFIENTDIFTWNYKDIERLEKLINPDILVPKKYRHLGSFQGSYISKYFTFSESEFQKNYVIEAMALNVFKSKEIKVGATLISIREENSKKVTNLLGTKDKKILDIFKANCKPDSTVYIKYQNKNSKIKKEIKIKTLGFNMALEDAKKKFLEYMDGDSTLAEVAFKEWKREFFYSSSLLYSRQDEIKEKKLKYKRKTLIDKFLSLEEIDNIDHWPVHLLERLKPILKDYAIGRPKNAKFPIFRRSYLSFFYEHKNLKMNDSTFSSATDSLVISSINQEPSDGVRLEAGDTLVSISELKPVRIGKKTSERAVNTVKLKTQSDLAKFLSKCKPGTAVKIKIFTKEKEKKVQSVTYLTQSFHEFIVEGMRGAYYNFTYNHAKADLITREFKQSYLQGFPDLSVKRIEEICKMDIWNEKDKEEIVLKFSEYYKYDHRDTSHYEYIRNWWSWNLELKEQKLQLLKKLLKPRFKNLNFETGAFNLFFNSDLLQYFKDFDTKIKNKKFTNCISFMLNWYVPGKSEDYEIKNFEKLISAKSHQIIGKTLLYDSASEKKKSNFFEIKKNSININYLSNQSGKLEKRNIDLNINWFGIFGFELVCDRFSQWLREICGKNFHKTKNNLSMKEWRESFFEGYPDFTLKRLNEIKEMDLEDDYYEEEDDYNDSEEKIYLSTTVAKEKVAGKESFVLTLDGLADDKKLETLTEDKKIFLKIYVFDVTDLDIAKYNEILDDMGMVDQYFSNHCHVIKTNDITWSDGSMNLIQSKELEPYGDHPTKLAFPYSVMLLPKVGKRKLSFRTFLCTDQQKFDDAEGRPKDGESINYRPESFKMNDWEEYGFDDYGDYPEILSYTSSEIDVEYMQPGYLDINRRKYNDLTIALGLALNQLGNKNLKESFEKIKDEIRYDGDHSAENNVYKSLSLKANYERALNKKIDLEPVLKELKKNSRIHERYKMIDLLLNLAITDETYSAKENEFIDKVAKSLELNNEKFQEIKKQKTASVKFVNFGDKADESIFGITKNMDKKEKLKVLRKEYSRWNALTNNNNKAIRERAREMRDLAANIRKQYT